ncbi:MAG: beta-ketoacyl-[acyl-carrier-protein] synthase family protein [Polaromonas sp.]|nr:beta-ketoacyl-[acyl-carrier-protein] synthase family protein [Polaromonas sp.]
MQALFLSDFTLTTCLGQGCEANWQAVLAQRSGLQRCDFETVQLNTFIGRVPGVEDQSLPARMSDYLCRNNQLALLALTQDGFESAVHQAITSYGPSRIGVFMGTSTSGILSTEVAYRHREGSGSTLPSGFRYAHTHNTFSVSSFVRDHFQLEGPAVAVSSACSSSAKVFGNASRMLECGLIDAAIVGGVDSLCLTTLYGFNSLELLSPERCRPFGAHRSGISISEAAGFALLTRERPPSPGAVAVTGIGESSDAHHMSSPHPEGAGALAAMQQALAMADLSPEAVDYINLHGTATPSNDAAEGKAVATLFGSSVPCSSTKGHTGHALGAAGIVEAILSSLAIRHGVLPGGVNTLERDAALDVNYLLTNQISEVRTILSNSFGFGGSNCALVVEKR